MKNVDYQNYVKLKDFLFYNEEDEYEGPAVIISEVDRDLIYEDFMNLGIKKFNYKITVIGNIKDYHRRENKPRYEYYIANYSFCIYSQEDIKEETLSAKGYLLQLIYANKPIQEKFEYKPVFRGVGIDENTSIISKKFGVNEEIIISMIGSPY